MDVAFDTHEGWAVRRLCDLGLQAFDVVVVK
jgi:hypothetical protein